MYGIDLGTTNSLIGKYNPVTGENEVSDLYPSFVNMLTKETGQIAKEQVFRGEKGIAFSYKTSILKKYAEIASFAILRALRNQVEDPGKEIAISVPAYFNTLQRNATIRAANHAGWDKVYLINEPTAAILAYGIKNKGMFLVYDLGGGTFDVSLMEVSNRYRTLTTYGYDVGGDDLDKAIVAHFKERVERDNMNIILDDSDWDQFRMVCNKAKHEIQKTKQDTDLYFMGCKYTLTVNMYKKLVYDVFQITFNLLTKALDEYEDLGFNIILVGGSTRDPFLQELLKDYCKIHEYNARFLPQTYNPDTIVAKGASFYAHLKEAGQLDIVADIVDSVGVGVWSDKHNCEIVQNIIIPNSIIPTKGCIYVGSDEGQDRIEFGVYKGQKSNEPCDESKRIGSMGWDIIDHSKANIFTLDVDVDINGIISVSASSNGFRTQKVVIKDE